MVINFSNFTTRYISCFSDGLEAVTRGCGSALIDDGCRDYHEFEETYEGSDATVCQCSSKFCNGTPSASSPSHTLLLLPCGLLLLQLLVIREL